MSTQRGNKNSDAIRILQRDRDASARATHLKAEIGMVPNSTIERKIMSTKTSIKRIALVAAAALTLGGFSAVSANAAAADTPFYVTTADAGVQTTADAAATQSASGVAGSLNFVAITAQTATLASSGTLGVVVTGANGTISATSPAAGADTLTVSGNTVTSANSILDGSVIKILTPTVGSFSVAVNRVTTNNTTGAVTTTLLQTFSFTVNAASIVGTFSSTASYAVRVDTTTAFTNNAAIRNFVEYETTTVPLTSSSTDSSAAIDKGAIGTATGVSVIAVKLMDTQATAAALSGKVLTATISGAGLISGTGPTLSADTSTSAVWATPSPVATSKTQGAGWAFFAVYSAGNAGVGTITVSYTNSSGTTSVVATKSVTFYGSLAALKVTQGKYILGASSKVGSANSTNYAVQVTGTDSSGNAVSLTNTSLSETSTLTTALAAATASAGGAVLDCVADTVNTSALDCAITAASTAVSGDSVDVYFNYGTVQSAPVNFKVGGKVIYSLTLAPAATSYNIGDLVTLNLTAKDSKGNPVADLKYTVFDTTTSTTVFATSAQLTSAPFGSAYVTFLKGVATATFYAPYTSGTLNLKATTNNAVVAPITDLVAAAQGIDLAAAISISGAGGDSSLAYDAASAATDAANNAYEEAQNATQAASDALAAVKALAVQVKALIALVNKIKAKLKA